MTRYSEAEYAKLQMRQREQSAFASLVLGWPPTSNLSVRHTSDGRHYLTDQYRAYKEDVAMRCTAAGWGKIEGRLRVTMHASPPDKRKRDLGNLEKCVCDSLNGILWDDDSQIDDLRILRTIGVPGSVTVFVEKMREPDGAAD